MQCNFLVLSFLIINIFIWLFYLLDIKYHLSESVLSLSIVYQCEVLLQAESSVYRCQSFGLRVTSNICWDDLVSPAALQHCTACSQCQSLLSSFWHSNTAGQNCLTWLNNWLEISPDKVTSKVWLQNRWWWWGCYCRLILPVYCLVGVIVVVLGVDLEPGGEVVRHQ